MSNRFSFNSSLKYSLLILLLLGLSPFNSAQAQEQSSTFIPQPALPSDLTGLKEIEESSQPIREDSESDTSQSITVQQPPAEPFDFFDAPYLLFTTIQFQNQTEMDNFLDIVEQDEEAENQFVFDKEVTDDGTLLLKSNYTQEAKPEGRKIVYYISADFPTQAEADQLAERLTHLYPDLFFAGQAFSLDNGNFDVILGVRTTTDAQAIRYNPSNQTIDYAHQREPYTYIVPEGQSDAIQVTIKQEYPDAFDFNEISLNDGSKQVTMTPRTGQRQFGIDTLSRQENFLNWISNLPLTYNQIVIITLIIVVILLALIAWLFFIK